MMRISRNSRDVKREASESGSAPHAQQEPVGVVVVNGEKHRHQGEVFEEF
jgi:hypothetical protein